MEQQRARPEQAPQKILPPPRLPTPASTSAPAVARPAPARSPARPSPAGSTAASTRLTAAGVGVVTCLVTLLGGAFDALVLDGPGALFGPSFLVASFYAAARVRSCDLAAAPVSAPIAFALTLLLTAPGASPGLSGRALAVVTGLAMHAGWLYAGTFLAAALALLRHFTLRAQRSNRNRSDRSKAKARA